MQRPWYCKKYVHGNVEKSTNVDGVTIYVSQETPCDCMPPDPNLTLKGNRKKKRSPQGSREPRLSRRDKEVLAKLRRSHTYIPSSAPAATSLPAPNIAESYPPRYEADPPVAQDATPFTVISPCERRISPLQSPTNIPVVDPWSMKNNTPLQAQLYSDNPYSRPIDYPYGNASPNHDLSDSPPRLSYTPPPPVPLPLPPTSAHHIYPIGEIKPYQPGTATLPPPYPSSHGLSPTNTSTCPIEHHKSQSFGLQFCPFCGMCLLPMGVAPDYKPEECPKLHTRALTSPESDFCYCTDCGAPLLPSYKYSEQAAINPTSTTNADLELRLHALKQDLLGGEKDKEANTAATINDTYRIRHLSSPSPSYAEITDADLKTVDRVLDKMLLRFRDCRRCGPNTPCDLPGCLLCHTGDEVSNVHKLSGDALSGGIFCGGPAVSISHYHYYK